MHPCEAPDTPDADLADDEELDAELDKIMDEVDKNVAIPPKMSEEEIVSALMAEHTAEQEAEATQEAEAQEEGPAPPATAADAGPAAEPAEPAKPAESEAPPAPPEYKTVDEIEFDKIPESHREWVRAAVKAALPAAQAALALKGELEETKERLNSVLSELDKAEGAGGKFTALGKQLEAHEERARTAAAMHGETAFRLFTTVNPDFKKAPAALRSSFGDRLAAGLHAQMKGTHLEDRLGDLWSFVKHEAGWKPDEPAPSTTPEPSAPRTPAAAAPAEPRAPAPAPQARAPAAGAAKAASVMNAGKGGSGTASKPRPVSERTIDDILNEHDYLLVDDTQGTHGARVR